jgi:hypothetical protein
MRGRMIQRKTSVTRKAKIKKIIYRLDEWGRAQK